MSNPRRKKSGQFDRNHPQHKMPTVNKSKLQRRSRGAVGRDRSDLDHKHQRLIGIWGCLGLGTLGLLLRLGWLQIIQASTLQQQAQNRQTVVERPFVPRRTIVDRSNNQVAIDRPSYTIYAHPKLFSEVVTGKGLPKLGTKVKIPAPEMAQRLAPILDKSIQELTTKFQQRQTGVLLGTGFSEDVVNRIRSLKMDGLDIRQGELDYTRFYPQDNMMAEVLGYIGLDETAKNRQAKAGVEYSQSLLLKREIREYRLTQTAKREILPDRVTPDFLHTDDLQLRLTVDLRLQRAAREALKQKMQEWKAPRGTVIVMDAETGAIRALVVEPTYNPNQYSNDVRNYELKVGKDRSMSLLRNSAVSDLYEPGSTFKPIAIAIALENGIIKPTSTIVDNGSVTVASDSPPIRNSHLEKNGTIDISQVLQRSSNVGMVKIMQRLKPDTYYSWLQRIGLGQKSGIDLPSEERGEFRTRREFLSSLVYPADTSFGQGFSVTPIQLVTLIGSIANGGKLVTPHVVDGLYDNTGIRKDKPTVREPIQIFSPHNANAVLAMMKSVVDLGSGIKAKIPGYQIAGKTGTSQKAIQGGYGKEKITSFVGILPVDGQHRYVVFAAIDEPKGKAKEKAFGSNVAAPIVKSVMESLISIEGIPPSDPAELKKYQEELHKNNANKEKTTKNQAGAATTTGSH
jgi:cell division protein FtsI (penicillin-binding protein 3)